MTLSAFLLGDQQVVRSNLLAELGTERRTQAATYAARLEERSSRASQRDSNGT